MTSDRATRTGRTIAAAALVAVAAAACATGLGGGPPAQEEGEQPVIRVSVRNDIVGGSTATVYIVTEDGINRQRLGTVGPDTTATFTYEPAALPETYRLLAEFTDGDELVSNRFTASGSLVVGWATEFNNVTVRSSSR